MSTYVPIDFEDGVTPLNAATFDHLEDRIELLDALKVPDPTGLDEKWLKAESGAMVWVDAPTGGGGAIEYENVWSAATPYQPGDVVEHEGVEYLAVNPSTGDEPAPAAAASPVGVIPLVTSLPATPFDGQEVILVDTLTGPPIYAWRFRYNAQSSSSFKWSFIGGHPILADNNVQGTTTSAAYVDLTGSPGPSITTPVDGVYQIEMGAQASTSTVQVGFMSFAIGAVAASDTTGLRVDGQQHVGKSAVMPLVAPGAGVALAAKFKVAGGATLTVTRSYLRLTPVRV